MLSWWRTLRALAVLNICLWLAVLHFGPASGVHGALQLALSGVYVLVCAYQVSGEYSMREAAAALGWVDRERAILEALVGIRRAGAVSRLTPRAAP